MLFNSYAFIFLYLPIVFIGMFWLSRRSHRLAALFMGFASLAFYAVWDTRFVLLLLTSIAFNFGAGCWIGRLARRCKQSRISLATAIAVNLILLGYFKYANFFITSANQFFGSHFPVLDIILPLGISFFTFTQIAFLVDVYLGIAREYNLIHYLLFVTYFPHLIAGPVLHHKQMMPQFADPNTYRINFEHVAVGLTIFIIGLAKKVLIADTLAEYATPIFNAAHNGAVLMLFEAWIGALAYTLQLYFDFSGYSDMAIGLSLIFNVRLPLNFNSPYKATSIIDFWRRWHISLSDFLRDYLYIPLGGNRKGTVRRYANLMTTMLLGGLWHGAGWTFIIWGGLHGVYLMINHGWRELKVYLGWDKGGRLADLAAGALTFLSVVVAWVFFRSDSFASAWEMLSGMAGMNGISLPPFLEKQLSLIPVQASQIDMVFLGLTPVSGLQSNIVLFNIVICLMLIWMFPNVQQIFATYKPAWEGMTSVKLSHAKERKRFLQYFHWELTYKLAIAAGILFFISLLYMVSNKTSEFLYFQF